MLEHDINPEKKLINEWVSLPNGNTVIHRFSINSSIVAYEVYEPAVRRMHSPFYDHNTITHHDQYGWLGQMTTRDLPDGFAALEAGSDERITAVEHYYAELAEEAARLIRLAFPEDFAGGTSPEAESC